MVGAVSHPWRSCRPATLQTLVFRGEKFLGFGIPREQALDSRKRAGAGGVPEKSWIVPGGEIRNRPANSEWSLAKPCTVGRWLRDGLAGGMVLVVAGCALHQPVEITVPDDAVLARLARPEAARITLRFGGVSLRLRPGDSQIRQMATLLQCVPESTPAFGLSRRKVLNDHSVYADIVDDVLQRAGFQMVNKAFGHPLSGRHPGQALVVLMAEITGLDLILCQDPLSMLGFQVQHRGAVRARLQWRAYAAGTGVLLGVLRSEGYAQTLAFSPQAQENLLEQAFQDAVVALAEDDAFQELLIRNAATLALPSLPMGAEAVFGPDWADSEEIDRDDAEENAHESGPEEPGPEEPAAE